jgi:hypothetical protein
MTVSGLSIGNILSILLNLINTGSVVIVLGIALRKNPSGALFRYFTVLSNILCAVSSFMVAVFRITGILPEAILLFKYAGTAAVTVTMMTVLLFLGPVVYDYKSLLSGGDLWLHLICPLLAIVTYLIWDKTDVPFWTVLFGVLPVLLYGILYLYRVVLVPEEKRWDDFYSFNKDGKWPVAFAAMIAAASAISIVLWAI